MDIQIGTKISLKFKDNQQEPECIFVGLEAPNYLIIRLPQAIEGTAIQEGRSLQATFTTSGNFYRMKTSILYFLEKYQLIFLSYPHEYEINALRKESRINCNIPATVTIQRKSLKGLITDISNNGCQFSVKIPTTFKLYRVSVLTDIDLSLSALGQSDQTRLKGKVRNTNIDEKKIVLGIEFDQLEDHFTQRLSGFIEKMKVLQ